MNGIGKKLCMNGFAVWCPFMIQEGNQTSQNNLAAMLLSRGISLHNVSCSALNAGEQLASRLCNIQFPKIGIYGVSWSAFLALHLTAAISSRRPVVASGYLRDEATLLASTSFMKALNFEFASYIHFNPNKFKFAGAELASLLAPTPLYFEIGAQDSWNSNQFGRDRIFADMQSAYDRRDSGRLITLDIFDGPHEANGVASINWLINNV